MVLFNAFVSAIMLGMSYASISVRNTYTPTSSSHDLLQFNITDLFTVSDIDSVTCTTSDPAATFFNQDSVINFRNLSQYHYGDQPEIVEYVSDQSFYAVYDNSNIVIQTVNLDHQSFAAPIQADFGLPGSDAVCTDLVINEAINRVYIACMSDLSSTKHDNIYIVEVDSKTGQRLNVITVHQNFPVLHRLQIRLVTGWPDSQHASPNLFVIVYDQGVSTGVTSGNKWFLVLDNADKGNLVSVGFANLATSDFSLKYLHDIYGFDHQLLISGQAANGTLGMAYCGFQTSSQGTINVNCSQYVNYAVYKSSYGYVGLMNTGQYVEVSLNASDPKGTFVYVCDIISSFYSSNFIDVSSCKNIKTFVIPQDVAVANIEGNVHQLVIKYCHFDSTYAGYSVHNFDLNDEFSHIDDSQAPHVVPLGKSLIKVDRDYMNITRQIEPYIYINVEKLKDDVQNSVSVVCTDGSGAKATNILKIRKLSDMRQGVEGQAASIPLLAAYVGHGFSFQLDPHEMLGNDLLITVDFDSSIKNYTDSVVYDSERANVNFRFNKGIDSFKVLHFAGRYALAKDSRNMILVFNCSMSGLATIDCVESAATNTGGSNLQLQEDIVEIFGYLATWGVDPVANVTILYIFDGDHTIYTHLVRGVATDTVITEIEDKVYFALAYQSEGLIRNFYIVDERPDFLREADIIDGRLASRPDFCPQNVSYDPNDGSVIEIFNYCPGKDQSILRYKYPPRVFNGKLMFPLVTRIPINFAYSKLDVCPMGNEFVVFSTLGGRQTLQSLNTFQDRNNFQFGTDDFNLGDLMSFNCVPKAKMFSTTSRDSNNNIILAVWWGNNQYQANHRLYKTVRSGLNDYKSIKSYEVMGQVIHVMSNGDGTYDFALTWSLGPVIGIKFFDGINATSVRMTLKYLNSMVGVRQISKEIGVIYPRNNVTIKQLGKLTGPVPEYIPVEDYININGTVTHAYITGSSDVRLIPRVSRVSVYKPAVRDYDTFSRIESNGDVVVGVHTSKQNSSLFTIFHNVDEFKGTYVPVHGVRSYGFAKLITCNQSILLAYSTAEVVNNSLQFVVLNGSTRVAIGHTNDGLIVDFSKVQVIPMAGAGNSWLVIGNNVDTGDLTIFRVDYIAGGQIKSKIFSKIPNVYWFSAVAPADLTDMYILVINLPWKQDFNGLVFDRRQSSTSVKARPWNLPKPDPVKLAKALGRDPEGLTFPNLFKIQSIECRVENGTCFYCLLNYEAPLIYEYVIDGSDPSTTKGEYMYYKLPGYLSMYLHGSSDYFVQLTESGDLQQTKYVFYKRISRGGQHDTYYSQDGDRLRSFTMTNNQNGTNMFMFLTGFVETPLYFLKVDKMSLQVLPGANLSMAHLEIEGLPGAPDLDIKVEDIIAGNEDDTKSVKFWPFATILGVLVVIALAYIVYNNSRANEQDVGSAVTEGVDTDKYVSLKP
jgi:hypothetical protein